MGQNEIMADANQTESDIKLSWEIRKLQAEVEALSRPFKNPSVIAALTTATFVALVSCAGLVIQWLRSDRDYTLAQIRAERLKLEFEKLQSDSENLKAEAKKLHAESEKLQTQRAALESEVAARRQELDTVLEKLKNVEATLAKKAISEFEREQVSIDLTAAADALKAVYELSEAASRVYYIVDRYKTLADRGIIKHTDTLSRRWKVDRSRFDSSLFVGVSRHALNEITIPAPSAGVTVLTIHARESWRKVPISSGETKIQITNTDKFWESEKYLVIAIRE